MKATGARATSSRPTVLVACWSSAPNAFSSARATASTWTSTRARSRAGHRAARTKPAGGAGPITGAAGAGRAAGTQMLLRPRDTGEEHFTKSVIYAGPFGNGSKLKFVANHAVYVHNCAASESLNYGICLGLEPKMIFDLLSNGAGQSKMSDLRMPLMIDGAYEPPTANMTIAEKDISVISADIKSNNCYTPLFDASQKLYDIAYKNVPIRKSKKSVRKSRNAAKKS